jgi:hypothetical protein
MPFGENKVKIFRKSTILASVIEQALRFIPADDIWIRMDIGPQAELGGANFPFSSTIKTMQQQRARQ